VYIYERYCSVHFVARLKRHPFTLQAFKEDVDIADHRHELSQIVNTEELLTHPVEEAVARHMSVDVEAEGISENVPAATVAEPVPLDLQAENISEGMSSGQGVADHLELNQIVNTEELLTHPVEEIHMSVDVEAEDISENVPAVAVAELVPLGLQAESMSAGMSSGQVFMNYHLELSQIVNTESLVTLPVEEAVAIHMSVDDVEAEDISKNVPAVAVTEPVPLDVQDGDISEGTSEMDSCDSDENYNPSCDDMESEEDSADEDNAISSDESLVPGSCSEGKLIKCLMSLYYHLVIL